MTRVPHNPITNIILSNLFAQFEVPTNFRFKLLLVKHMYKHVFFAFICYVTSIFLIILSDFFRSNEALLFANKNRDKVFLWLLCKNIVLIHILINVNCNILCGFNRYLKNPSSAAI